LKPIRETTIAKFSMGVLFVIASGLVAGTTYIVTLGNASTQQERRIGDLETKTASVDVLTTRLAVIETKLDILIESNPEALDAFHRKGRHRNGNQKTVAE